MQSKENGCVAWQDPDRGTWGRRAASYLQPSGRPTGASEAALTPLSSSVKFGKVELRKRSLLLTRPVAAGLLPIAILLTVSGCAVRRTTRIAPSQVPPVAREASAGELVDRVNAASRAFRTLKAQVDLTPTAGSVYSGVIKEYHDVKGFILLEKPATIRMIGQAPVVRTDIFDMVADGSEFRLYVPSKQKFIVGKTSYHGPVKNALENLRPQHMLEALVIPPVDPAHEEYFSEEAEDGGRQFYALNILGRQAESSRGQLALRRKVWFDRSTLDIARLEDYGPGGKLLEDVHFSNYQDFQGIRYPSSIQINRPVEDYSLGVTIQKATFNEPIAAEKFELKKPDGAQLVRLSGEPGGPGSPGAESSRDE